MPLMAKIHSVCLRVLGQGRAQAWMKAARRRDKAPCSAVAVGLSRAVRTKARWALLRAARWARVRRRVPSFTEMVAAAGQMNTSDGVSRQPRRLRLTARR